MLVPATNRMVGVIRRGQPAPQAIRHVSRRFGLRDSRARITTAVTASATTLTEIFGVGLGITAYALGMRHAFDADHIAAIDGTTRKLMADGQRPLSVGFWFAHVTNAAPSTTKRFLTSQL